MTLLCFLLYQGFGRTRSKHGNRSVGKIVVVSGNVRKVMEVVIEWLNENLSKTKTKSRTVGEVLGAGESDRRDSLIF